jgi:hypothetical protein
VSRSSGPTCRPWPWRGEARGRPRPTTAGAADACLEVPDHGKPARRHEVFFLPLPTHGKFTSDGARSPRLHCRRWKNLAWSSRPLGGEGEQPARRAEDCSVSVQAVDHGAVETMGRRWVYRSRSEERGEWGGEDERMRGGMRVGGVQGRIRWGQWNPGGGPNWRERI